MSDGSLDRAMNRGARGKPKEPVKHYTFSIAPVLVASLQGLGYDTAKIGNAVEAHGNDNLKVVDTSAKSANRYTPERANSRVVKPAESAATATTTIKFGGDGSAPRQFAAWHDDTVKMIGKYGELSALPLPVGLRAWLDSKFKATIKLGKPAARSIKPEASEPSAANGSNGTHAEATK